MQQPGQWGVGGRKRGRLRSEGGPHRKDVKATMHSTHRLSTICMDSDPGLCMDFAPHTCLHLPTHLEESARLGATSSWEVARAHPSARTQTRPVPPTLHTCPRLPTHLDESAPSGAPRSQEAARAHPSAWAPALSGAAGTRLAPAPACPRWIPHRPHLPHFLRPLQRRRRRGQLRLRPGR